MSDWEGGDFEEVGGGEADQISLPNQPEEEQPVVEELLQEVGEQPLKDPVDLHPLVEPEQQPIDMQQPAEEKTVEDELVARTPQPPPATPPQRKQPVMARPAVVPVVEYPTVEEVPVAQSSPAEVKRIVSVDIPPREQSVQDAVSESSYVMAASLATPRTPSVEMPTHDEKSLLERLDAICTLLNQPIGGGIQVGSMADLSGHAIRNIPIRHSPLTALDAQQRFPTPRLHYAHQLDCFYHYVFLEAPGPNMTGLGDHLQRLYDDKRANIPLLLSEFLGSEENLFRLLLLKYNRPTYSRFVHFSD